MRLQLLLTAWFALAWLLTGSASADTFGSGANTFEIDFVPIGAVGNAADEAPNSAGAVDYLYRMGKYEVSEAMIDVANQLGGLGITKDTRGANQPATSVSWFEAARFVNWLNTSTGHTPAYKFSEAGEFELWLPSDSGYDANNLFRNRRARYFLPSTDEWHKAAYYDPVAEVYYDYPTGSDNVPDGIDFAGDSEFDAVFFDGGLNPGPNDVTDVGLHSPFGTAGQGGNVFEWHETAFDSTNSFPSQQRSQEGGAWDSPASVLSGAHTGIGTTPTLEIERVGFRVASIPEPRTATMLALLMLLQMTFKRIQDSKTL